MSNILLSPTALEISPAAERAQKVELLEQNDISLLLIFSKNEEKREKTKRDNIG